MPSMYRSSSPLQLHIHPHICVFSLSLPQVRLLVESQVLNERFLTQALYVYSAVAAWILHLIDPDNKG